MTLKPNKKHPWGPGEFAKITITWAGGNPEGAASLVVGSKSAKSIRATTGTTELDITEDGKKVAGSLTNNSTETIDFNLIK